MIEHTYQVLGYYRLLDILSHYAACPLGQSDCLSLKPFNDPKQIDNELRLVAEMRLLLKTERFVSLTHVTNLASVFRKSSALGSCLEPDEFLCVSSLVEAGRQSKKFIRLRRALLPRLYDLLRDMPDFESLENAIKKTISLNGAIKDSASAALRKIRERKIQQRRDLEKELQSIRNNIGLSSDRQGHLVTIRDGRYVLALRTDQKSLIEGIVHDYSQTKATCFLEPVEVIRDNNRAAELAQEEKEEESRILERLTGMVREQASELKYAQDVIGRLDGIYARAGFSEAQSCVMPEIGEKYGVELKEAKNPILVAMGLENRTNIGNKEFPVPVDILLDDDHNVLVISGPNRGGKTVTLKTLGLMSLMAQAGIHIPAQEGSCLPIFDQVMADIGDDQDIQAGLSTFSAHAAHLTHILRETDKRSLVIIDEPGMGTDPDEGVALSMAVLDFLSRQGTFVAVSTHSNRLKAYGVSNPRAVSASVDFDSQKICPTFKLKYGVPGISHALDVAREMGVPSDILHRAGEYLDRDEVRLNRLLEKMNRLLMESEQDKREAKDLKERYLSAASEMKQKLDSLENERRALIEEKKLEAEAAIREAKDELRQTINLLKKKKKTAQAYVTKRHDVVGRKLVDYFEREARQRNKKPYTGHNKFEKGQLVYHKELKQKGVIQSVDLSGGRVSVRMGNLKMSSSVQDIEVIKDFQGPSSKGSPSSVSWRIDSAAPRELNVIGFRVDDAIPLIDKTIDRALVDGELTLRIVHGFGTGRLRDAIRGHLRGVPFVKRVLSADPRLGGDAITIVEW